MTVSFLQGVPVHLELIGSNTYSVLHIYDIVNSMNQYYLTGGVSMHFRRLKDLRQDKDLTQEEIGKMLGIQQNVYSRYERGAQNIPLQHLLLLADFYNTSTDYLLGRTSNPNPPEK